VGHSAYGLAALQQRPNKIDADMARGSRHNSRHRIYTLWHTPAGRRPGHPPTAKCQPAAAN